MLKTLDMSPSNSRRRKSHKKKNNNKKIIMVLALFAVVAVAVVGYVMLGNNTSSNSSPNEELPTTNKVMLVTSMGNILIELRDDMPITTNNFKNLAQQGTYDGTIFHRVVNLPQSLVMVQGGDPNGNGISDDSIPAIPDEFSDSPENNKNERGTIAMANAGANTGSSQFFINDAYNSHLDNIHPVFGDVIEGMDVVDAILQVDTDENGRPVEDVTLFTADFVD